MIMLSPKIAGLKTVLRIKTGGMRQTHEPGYLKNSLKKSF